MQMGIFHVQILLRGSYFPRRAKTEKYFDMRYSESTPCSHSGQVFSEAVDCLCKNSCKRALLEVTMKMRRHFFFIIRMQMALSIWRSELSNLLLQLHPRAGSKLLEMSGCHSSDVVSS